MKVYSKSAARFIDVQFEEDLAIVIVLLRLFAVVMKVLLFLSLWSGAEALCWRTCSAVPAGGGGDGGRVIQYGQ